MRHDPVGEAIRGCQSSSTVAMLFILFDIGSSFFIRGRVVYKAMLTMFCTRIPNMILGSMLSFLAILFAGYTLRREEKAFDGKV